MWNSNPYTLGSYSFIHANSKSAESDVNNLAEPIYVDKIVNKKHLFMFFETKI